MHGDKNRGRRKKTSRAIADSDGERRIAEGFAARTKNAKVKFLRDSPNCVLRAQSAKVGSEVLLDKATDDLSGELRVFISRTAADIRRLSRGSEKEQLRAASLELAEADHIRRAMEACGGNKSQAARLLQIDRRSLQRKIARLGGKRKKASRKKR